VNRQSGNLLELKDVSCEGGETGASPIERERVRGGGSRSRNIVISKLTDKHSWLGIRAPDSCKLGGTVQTTSLTRRFLSW